MKLLLKYLLAFLWTFFTVSLIQAQDKTARQVELESEISKLRQESDSKKLAKALYKLGRFHYRERRDYNDAVAPLKEAFGLADQLNDKYLSSDASFDLGQVYLHKDDHEKAYFYFTKAITYREAIGNPNTLADACMYAGQSAIAAGKYDEAIKVLERALKLGEKVGRKTVMQRAYDELASAYAHIGDTEREREARRKSQDLFKEDATSGLVDERQKNDSTRRVLSRKEYELDRTKREITRKQKELTATEARLDSVISEKERRIEELKQKEEELRKKEEELEGMKGVLSVFKSTTIGISIILILALVSGLLLYRAYQARLQLNKQLEAKNEEIESQRDQLMVQHRKMEEQKSDLEKLYNKMKSSINYAQRIQFAMLPSITAMRNNFKDSFVYLQPRDPVSGDFYWMRNVNGKTVIAAVDCTGHGVPGAFMSLIGNDLLNTIVVERKILDPEQILGSMNEGVREALKQGVSRNNDGMDIALCVIDNQSRTVHFAGAKNPLYYINGTGEIEVIKGDRYPVGGMQGELEREYTRHSINLKPDQNYTFYLSSDGFQDQFGGKEGRKFLRSNFRKLLQDIHQEPMDQQSEILEQTLSEWMENGKHRQIDDVLIVGFRL